MGSSFKLWYMAAPGMDDRRKAIEKEFIEDNDSRCNS
jgi:hypothetical protein